KLLLDDVAVIRKIPMSNLGCDNLRASQRFLVDGLSKKMNATVEIPFPMVIHMVLAYFVKENGINVGNNGGSQPA
ncbi:DUF7195 family protein, partial [Herbiconiux daphne]